jgi:hypothetical protein
MRQRPWSPAWIGWMALLSACASPDVGTETTTETNTEAITGPTTLEAEALTLPSGNGMVTNDAAASGGGALLIWSNGTASGSHTTDTVARITVRARGEQCQGAPQMVVKIDNTQVLSQAVAATAWQDYGVNVDIAAGAHNVQVTFTNDFQVAGTCDRNLLVDKIVFTPPSSNPFAYRNFYIDPNSSARAQATAWRASRPADAAQMDKIAGQPIADWYGDWVANVETSVRARVDTIAAAGALPVLVAYNIPQRDCGSYSAGGANNPDGYRAWIQSFSAGIGGRRAVVILEPDAVPQADCLSATDRATRFSLLNEAVGVLRASSQVAVYIDAGNAHWVSAAETATRLQSSGIAQATGFSINVSNFYTTAESITFGNDLASRVGNKHYLIDTSRNGLGHNGEWCNPAGRALGDRPTAATGSALVDAFFWVKRVGESDGTCNGGPSAGTWWPEYALGLAQRAAY